LPDDQLNIVNRGASKKLHIYDDQARLPRKHGTIWTKRLSILALASVVAGCGQSADQNARGLAEQSCTGLTTSEMVWIPSGKFTLGENPRYGEEGPPRRVSVQGFWMDAHEVTNAQFTSFVKSTGYKSTAEQYPPTIPGAPPEMMLPGSAVFAAPTPISPQWWRWVVGAQWRHPSGPTDSIEGKDREPVVQITYQDASAYARWAGKELPTEEQWEFAARAGGNALPEPVDQQGKPQANYYQGVFPVKDLGSDGYLGRAPVGCFPPNAFGLYDMIGNVWEWTKSTGSRPDAREPVQIIKGGSYLCAANYCARYRPAARQFQEQSLGTDHIGFRLVDNYKAAPD
jgi:sulfatase modifying factor 1